MKERAGREGQAGKGRQGTGTKGRVLVLMMVAMTGFEKVRSRVATTVGTRGFEKVLRKGDGL